MKRRERKIIMLTLLCVSLLLFMLSLSACGSKQDENAAKETDETAETTEEAAVLSSEELMDIAFADAGFSISAGSDIKISATKEGIKTVSFKISNAEYSYDINEVTGEIVNSTKPEVAPDTDVDPIGVAMSKLGEEENFIGASNIHAQKTSVDGRDAVVITFDNGGNSFEYIYDIESGELKEN